MQAARERGGSISLEPFIWHDLIAYRQEKNPDASVLAELERLRVA
jgi:hypothetical protein